MRGIERQNYESSTDTLLRTRSPLILLLAGAAIGAGLALLLAPQSGPELRASIARGYRKTLVALTGSAQDLRERARHLGGLSENVPNVLRFRRRTSRTT